MILVKLKTLSNLIFPINKGAEIAHISFITELRHKRDLSQNEYHIIKLTSQNTVNTKTQSMEIHLHKREAITSTDFQ